MSRNKNLEPESEVIETVVTESVQELTPVQKIQKMIADKQAAAVAERVRLDAMEAEAEALSTIEIDSEVEDILNTIDSVSKDTKTENELMVEELKSLKEQVEAIVASHQASFDNLSKMAADAMVSLVAKVGEVASKALTSGTVTGKAKGTRVGGTRRGGVRELVLSEVCDMKKTPEAVAAEHSIMGNGEQGVGAKQKVGHLVRRHLDLSAKDGFIVKNTDGTYSRT